MKLKTILLPVLATAISSTSLSAVPAFAQDDYRPAQAREIEVYYDQHGRRVIRDAYTGEILRIERPRNLDRRATGSVPPGQPRYQDPYAERGGRYYLDDPEDMRRLERDRARGYGVSREEYDPAYSDSYEDQAYPGDEASIDGTYFPPAPGGAVYDEPVERRALPTPSDEPRLSPSAPADQPTISKKADLNVAKLQVLLDRAGVSPGVIDGHMGGNVDKAIAAYQEITGVKLSMVDFATVESELAARGGEAFTDYTITPEDVAGPYVASIPADYSEKAQLEAMSYTSVVEMLAERFHMSETYLKDLNKGVEFRPGAVIRVADTGGNVTRKVASIIADKGREQVRAYDAMGRLVVAYPATIGSSDTPSPSGTHSVERVAINPEYTYNPKINFTQGNNTKVLRIPPGPNGPVGSVWIALSKPTYGIHGTPDPSKIGKTNSHGCVRLTNWDAQELAKLVTKGVTVEFVE